MTAEWRDVRIGRAHRWLAAALLAPALACSHFTPYVRPDVARHAPPAAPATVDHRLVLIGDTGDPDATGEPVLQLLARRVRQLPERTTVVFLGDVVYERGMPEPVSPAAKPLDALADAIDVILPDLFASRQEAERQLGAQIDVVAGTPARGIFVAGNHDWDQFEVGGWQRILALEQFLREAAAAGRADVALVPRGGCPGPVAVPVGRTAVLLAIDTQWWIETRKDGKPTPADNPTGCPYVTEDAVHDRLVAELEGAARAGLAAIVAAHHPLETEGPHGGFVDARTHLFPLRIIRHYVPFWLEWIPLPVLGSVVVWVRECCSPSAQDMANRRNRHMRRTLERAFRAAARRNAAPLVYAAGHDHTLQIFEGRGGPRYTLVSGMGSRASAVGSNRRTLFAHANPLQPGFMEIDFLRGGGARLAVREHDAANPEGTEVFAMLLGEPA